jgi:hypothetical protein
MSLSTLVSPHQLNAGPLLSAIDSIPGTRGMGCYVSLKNQMRKLRTPRNAGSTVVIELRPPVGSGLPATQRGQSTSPLTEWANMGLNCGSAAVSWVGVAGGVAGTPVSVVSAIGAAFLYGGAIASTAQCSVSIVRVTDLYDGNQALNAAMDQSKAYVWTMYTLDGVGLASMAYDFFNLPSVINGAGGILNAAAKGKLLNVIFDAAGATASLVEPGGVLYDTVVWITPKAS